MERTDQRLQFALLGETGAVDAGSPGTAESRFRATRRGRSTGAPARPPGFGA